MWSEYHEKLFFLNKLYFNKIFSLNFIICFLWRLKVLHIYFYSALVHFYESSKTLFKCSLCSLRVLPHTTISSWELALPGISELMEVISLWKTLLAEWIPQGNPLKQSRPVAITTAQLNSTKPELRFCISSNPACGVSEIRDGEEIWQWSWLEIRLNAFCWSTTPQKQFIIRKCELSSTTFICQ